MLAHAGVVRTTERDIDLSTDGLSSKHSINSGSEAELQHPGDHSRIREVHPEVSFATWNDGRALAYRKTHVSGRAERERLIDSIWNGERERMWTLVEGTACRRDDLNDALAALWTARRIARGTARRVPWINEFDGRGLRMEIAA